MIESITVKNFQRHEKLRVDFDPYLSVIVGQTDAGKSSVLRAIRWICTNRPGGTAFARLGSGGGVSVRLKVDGITLRRSRDGGRNLYELDGDEYRAFGSGVPDPVSDLLNVSDLNFQGQHDAAFFFSLPPGEVAKRLNAVVDLELIDTTLANVSAVLRATKVGEEVAKNRLEDCTAKREALAWVTKADADLKDLESEQADIAFKRARINTIESLLDEVDNYVRERREASAMRKDASVALEKAEASTVLRGRLERVEDCVNEVKRLRAERCRLEKEKAEAETTLRGALEEGCPLCDRPPTK